MLTGLLIPFFLSLHFKQSCHYIVVCYSNMTTLFNPTHTLKHSKGLFFLGECCPSLEKRNFIVQIIFKITLIKTLLKLLLFLGVLILSSMFFFCCWFEGCFYCFACSSSSKQNKQLT